MVVAYLRGLLKPTQPYGRRSRISEDVVIEAMASGVMADNLQDSVKFSQALLPLLNQRGIHNSNERIYAQLDRVSELRVFDLYKVAEQLGGHLKVTNGKKEMSLYQLYQIAEKHGIFDAFADEANLEKEKFKPMI